jgi:hypothetical protein
MDPQLEAYKKNKTNELVSAFNNTFTSLRSQLQSNINIIQKSKLHTKNKNNSIHFLNQKYNSTITQLKKNLATNIKKVNLLTSLPQRKTSDKFALLIGINYKNTPKELYGCINDTKNIQNILQTKYGFKNFVFLTDDTNNKPTKQNIIYALTKLLVNSISGDSLFFLYSGHGTCTTDLNNDELDGQDELIVPINATNIKSCILDDELNQIIKNNLKPGVKLFALFDSCFSGTILDLKYSLDKLDNVIINPNIIDTLGQVFMISGCTDKQTSADTFINNQNTGAMTFSFIQTIEQYGTSITLKQLVENMRNLLTDNGFEQIPQLSSGKSVDINTQTFLF